MAGFHEIEMYNRIRNKRKLILLLFLDNNAIKRYTLITATGLIRASPFWSVFVMSADKMNARAKEGDKRYSFLRRLSALLLLSLQYIVPLLIPFHPFFSFMSIEMCLAFSRDLFRFIPFLLLSLLGLRFSYSNDLSVFCLVTFYLHLLLSSMGICFLPRFVLIHSL